VSNEKLNVQQTQTGGRADGLVSDMCSMSVWLWFCALHYLWFRFTTNQAAIYL